MRKRKFSITEIERLIEATPTRSGKVRKVCEALQNIEDERFIASETNRNRHICTLQIAAVLFDCVGQKKTGLRLNELALALSQLDVGVLVPLLECGRRSRISLPVWLARAGFVAGAEVLTRTKNKSKVAAILDKSEWRRLEKPLHVIHGKSLSESVLGWLEEFNKSDFKQLEAKSMLERMRASIVIGKAQGRSAEDLAMGCFCASRDSLRDDGLLTAA
jgi:hypothetical protein